jgi:hypothetical protein
MRFGFANKKWKVSLFKDTDGNVAEGAANTKTHATDGIETNEWTYVVYSVKLDSSAISDTDITLFKNKTTESTLTTFAGAFVVDPQAYPAYICIGKSDATTFTNHW